MQRNGKKSRKIRKLIIASTLSAVVLIVSTYTWFIGMTTVKVNPFEINIASTEGLFLSMDGNKWSYQLDVVGTEAYSGHTNVWASDGLIPLSTVGDFDIPTSRMKLYEKGSYTPTAGGYRLLASQVKNTGDVDEDGDVDAADDQGEAEGYIAFDLFIKNLSGDEYYTALDTYNEEAIYLTTDSSVIENSTGSNGESIKTGIENSVRVGFIQVGRVTAESTDVSEITSIKCSTKAGTITGNVTSICRDAQIWEPNEKKHVQDALDWYTKSCAKRTGDSVYEKTSYSTSDACTSVTLENAGVAGVYNPMQTYAITKVLGINDNVDVYDGLNYFTTMTQGTEKAEDDVKVVNDYATYAAADAAGKAKMTLVNYDYFTDAEKNLVGTDRPTFMTLAPNSITKVRVYIWLEGQDIDNYNFAQLGKQIQINFGFTKERFRSDESSKVPPYTYDGPGFETSDPDYWHTITPASNS